MENSFKVRLHGVAPLLMCSAVSANPLHPLTKEIKKITSKPAKQKTDHDAEMIADLEYQLHMYYDPEIGPYIPAEVAEANIRDGARKSRKGKDVQAGVIVMPDKIPLLYNGPRKMEDLLKDVNFRDVRTVGINTGSKKITMRCRPRFNRWDLEYEVHFNPSVISKETLMDAIKLAGQQCAIGDYRPRYGRFSVEFD